MIFNHEHDYYTDCDHTGKLYKKANKVKKKDSISDDSTQNLLR